jgi:pimeloyl-ACP methyl ester carboxylesterase
LGHSEGSLIGMLAAQKEKVNAFISVSGIAAKADKIIEKQIASQSKELAGKATIILDSLDKGYKVRNIDPSLEELFHPSVQPYLISWLKYEPRTEIKKLSIPVLIIQGTTDLNVGVDEAEGLKKAYPAATLKIIPGMNHMLKPAPKDRMKNLETYKNPDLPLSPALVSDIVSFVNSVK